MIVIVAAQSSPDYARKYFGATTKRTNKQFEEPVRDLFRIISHPRHHYSTPAIIEKLNGWSKSESLQKTVSSLL